MSINKNMFLVIVLFLFSSCALAAGPEVRVKDDLVILANGANSISANLKTGHLDFNCASGKYGFDASFLSDDKKGWGFFSPVSAKPDITRQSGVILVEINYPVSNNRLVSLELSAYDKLPAIFVTTKLTPTQYIKDDYYFWQTNIPLDWLYAKYGDSYELLKPAKDNEILECRDWLYIPAKTGGIAVFPMGRFGNDADKKHLYLLPTPSSYTLAPGETHNLSFGIAGVKDVEEACAVFDKAKKLNIPALSHIPGSSNPEYGQPAPRWLLEANAYTLHYTPANTWTDEAVNNHLKHFSMVIGSTPDKAALDKCHKAGVKVLYYIIWMELLDTDLQKKGGREVYAEWLESIGHEERDLKDHPNWVCIDADGKAMRSAFSYQNNHPGLHAACLHQKDLHKAALKQVKAIMDMGFDGVFIDNAGVIPECYGEKFGIHKHVSGKSNNQMYEELEKDIYKLVKSYGNERVVCQNGRLTSHWPYCDMWMWEAAPYDGKQWNGDWAEFLWQGKEYSRYLENGKAPAILPYYTGFNPDTLRKADFLFSYAYAKLFNMLWSDDFGFRYPGMWNQKWIDFGVMLADLRLGKAAGEIKKSNNAYFREFERGIVLINPMKNAISVTVPARNAKRYEDVGYGRVVNVSRGKLAVVLEPLSGKVLYLKE